MEHKFIRLVPDEQPPDFIWNKIGMIVHMLNNRTPMTIRDVQAQLLNYYSDYVDDCPDSGELSLAYITVCLYLACAYHCAKEI